jgi:hypothetical protein
MITFKRMKNAAATSFNRVNRKSWRSDHADLKIVCNDFIATRILRSFTVPTGSQRLGQEMPAKIVPRMVNDFRNNCMETIGR